MKNNNLKQLLKLTTTILACAAIVIGNPVPALSGPDDTGIGQSIEIPGAENNSEEPGISPQNDKDKENSIPNELF